MHGKKKGALKAPFFLLSSSILETVFFSTSGGLVSS
jgi:hypothetical protein